MMIYVFEKNCNLGKVFIGLSDNKTKLVFLSFENEENTNSLSWKRLASVYKDRSTIWGYPEEYRCELVDQILYCLNNNVNLNVPLSIKGTDFQKSVWSFLVTIPAGTTATYKQVAEAIGNPKAVRAVGTACKNNPIAYFIPCHRVVPSDGKMGQYLWGVGMKQQLLDRENIANAAQQQCPPV